MGPKLQIKTLTMFFTCRENKTFFRTFVNFDYTFGLRESEGERGPDLRHRKATGRRLQEKM